jgi:hypothetical protein
MMRDAFPLWLALSLVSACATEPFDRHDVEDEADLSQLTEAAARTLAADANTRTFEAVADAFVRSRSAQRNYRNRDHLRVRKARTSYRSYVRFDLSQLRGSVRAAKLMLFVLNGSRDGGTLSVTDDTWKEDKISWNIAPPPTDVLDSAGRVSAGEWVSFDARAVVQGGGVYSFLLRSSSHDSALYSSREGIAPPVLIVQLDDDGDAATASGITQPDADSDGSPDAGVGNDADGSSNTPADGAAPSPAGDSSTQPEPSPAEQPDAPAEQPDAQQAPSEANAGLPSPALFVATWGSDDDAGTEAAPMRTIQHAVDQATPGDTVVVMEGTYRERIAFSKSGRADAWITLMSYPEARVVVDSSSASFPSWWSGAIDLTGVSYVRLQGLRVEHSSHWGIIANNASEIEIRDNSTYDTARSGIGLYQSNNVMIRGNKVELAVNGGDQECITVWDSSYVEVSYNEVSNDGAGDIGGEGIDVKDGSNHVVVRGNYVHDLDELGIYVDSYGLAQDDILIEGNVVHDCVYGIAIGSERGALLENVVVRNNIVHHNRWVGIVIHTWDEGYPHPVRGVQITNNTVVYNAVDSSWGGGIAIWNPEARDLTVRNNIVAFNAHSQMDDTTGTGATTFSHNLVFGPTGIAGDRAVVADPLFVDATAYDFHLAADSPAIDAGSETDAPETDYAGSKRPSGPTVDIGAFEWH